jgi:hypothetical protein
LGWVADPSGIRGLLQTRPDAEQHPVVAGRYDVTPKGGRKSNPDGPWLWCSHCQAHKHWIGIVVVDDAGHFYLIGQDCGERHYGADRFRLATRRFNDIEYALDLDRRLGSIAAAAQSLSDEARDLLSCDALASLEQKRNEVAAACPMASQRLTTYARSGLSLTAHERARGLKGTNVMSVDLGAVEGPALLFSDVRAKCADMSDAVQAIVEFADDYQALSNVEKKRLVGAVDLAAGGLLGAVAECAQASRFFSRRNYRRLERWAVPLNRFFSIHHEEDALVFVDAALGAREVRPLQAGGFPSMKVCRKVAGK